MSEQFIGEIRAFGFEPPPRDWAVCDGQLLQVSANRQLYELLGNTFGGERGKTFAVPDLRGRVAVDQGGSAGPIGKSGTGGGAPQAYQALVYAIAIQGYFPVVGHQEGGA